MYAMPIFGNSGNGDRDNVSWEQADLIQSATTAGGARKHFTPPSLNPPNMFCTIMNKVGKVQNAQKQQLGKRT